MSRFRLSTMLLLINVGLLLAAVAGVAVIAAGLLEQLADEQALARVTQAALTARQEIERSGDSTLAAAELLAERPTLLRLLQNNDAANLDVFLTQFQNTSRLDGSAVVRERDVVAASGATLPWPTIPAAANQSALFRFEGQPLTLIARAPVSALAGTDVFVATQLDAAFTRALGDDLGLAIVFDATTPITTSDDITAVRDDELARYRATLPLRGQGNEIVGAVTASLPTSGVAASLSQFTRTLLLLAVSVSVVAGLAGFLLGRRLSRPLLVLSSAAHRIGQGDLATPIGVAGSGEIGALATTLEEMRRRLLRLTVDLRRQQAESQAIITGIVEGVFSVDRERRIRYINPQVATMLGLDSSTVVGQFCGDVLNPQGPNGVRPCASQCPIIHARFRGGAHATEHLLLLDGTRRTVVITSALPADERQMQVMRDETETEAIRRLRDAVLANISHEFRTPLSAQLASIELLLDQLPDLTGDQIDHLVRALQRGTLRLTQLIDNLLESARIEAGRAAIRRGPIALDEVIEEALELTRPLLEQRAQRISVELPFPLPSVEGDAKLLIQVFVNLLANANKFAPNNSTIAIGGDVSDEWITLWVADEGPGLPVGDRRALFDRFVRSGADEPEQTGVGLGLAIVQSIVERHGGRVEPISDGAGTRMGVVLPVGK